MACARAGMKTLPSLEVAKAKPSADTTFVTVPLTVEGATPLTGTNDGLCLSSHTEYEAIADEFIYYI